MSEDSGEITQERWIAWAERVFEGKNGKNIEVEFLGEEWAPLNYNGNVRIVAQADGTYEYITLFFDFNHPPIF